MYTVPSIFDLHDLTMDTMLLILLAQILTAANASETVDVVHLVHGCATIIFSFHLFFASSTYTLKIKILNDYHIYFKQTF